MSKNANAYIVHPATRSNKFVNKSFTENVICNIVKVCSAWPSFIIDDLSSDGTLDMNSIFYHVGQESGASPAVIKMVINGYYVEVPIENIESGMRYFYIVEEDL